jgi:hypothetical protein
MWHPHCVFVSVQPSVLNSKQCHCLLCNNPATSQFADSMRGFHIQLDTSIGSSMSTPSKSGLYDKTASSHLLQGLPNTLSLWVISDKVSISIPRYYLLSRSINLYQVSPEYGLLLAVSFRNVGLYRRQFQG